MTRQTVSIISREIVVKAIWESFAKLDPRTLYRNPVIFVVELGSVVVTALFVRDAISGDAGTPLWFTGTVAFWLWLTVLFANFSEAVAEGRGKAQADSLRTTRTTTFARRRLASGALEDVPAPELRRGDVVVVEAGDVIPADGDVVEGAGSVDESAITGESAPVIREAGGDRSAVTGGTRLLSDRLVIEVTQEPGGSFLDRMIALVEGAERRKTPNEVALNVLLVGLTIAFLFAVVTLQPFADFADTSISLTVLIALLVALIPTTIGALLSAIGIAGMDRLVQRNVLAMSGRAVEAAGDVDVLLLDKTGTITLGNRQASGFLPVAGVDEQELAEAAQFASLADETPEGRSIVVLAKEHGIRERRLTNGEATFIPFSASTRMSGVDVDGRQVRKGAPDAIKAFIGQNGGRAPDGLDALVQQVAEAGGTPLVVARDSFALGVVQLEDIVKGGMHERFGELRRMGIRTVMITGDNPVTAAVIAREAGVDDFLAQATPEAKLALIREEQGKGRMVAMTGDGTNDAPALAQSDVGVAMNTGTAAAKDDAGSADDLLDRERHRQVLRDPPRDLRLHLRGRRRSDRASRLARRDAPGIAGERDHLGDRLQRARHPVARPAGAARRPLPADRRDRSAAPQPARLRPRRHRGAVRRDQADRPRRAQPARRVGSARCGAGIGSSSARPRASARRTGCCSKGARRRPRASTS
jgi:K+-transporting ATPase ATPase B chain